MALARLGVSDLRRALPRGRRLSSPGSLAHTLPGSLGRKPASLFGCSLSVLHLSETWLLYGNDVKVACTLLPRGFSSSVLPAAYRYSDHQVYR